MQPSDRLIVEFLALRNAIFTPVRRWGRDNLHANAFTLRNRYNADGSPYRSGKQSGAERVQAHRELRAVVDGGHVTPITQSGSTVGVKLTAAGELRAASLAGLFTAGSFESLDVLAAMMRRKIAAVGVCEVPEDDLLGLPIVKEFALKRTQSLVLIGELLLPYMVLGFIAGRSTIRRNVRYWFVKAPPADFDYGPPVELIFSEEAHELYLETFDAERERLGREEIIDRGEIGPIPLPVAAVGQYALDDWKMSAELAARGE